MASETFRQIKGYGADNLDSALRSVLEPGERVLWKGRPTVSVDYKAFFIWLFAIPWTAFSMFWVVMTWRLSQTSAPDEGGMLIAAKLFPLFGVPFVIVGLVMMVSPFLAMTVPGRTLNAVTDRRILRVVGGWKASLRVIPGEWVKGIDHKAKFDGTGTLIISYEEPDDQKGRRAHHAEREGVQMMTIRHLPSIRSAVRAAEEMRLNCAASSLSAGRNR